MSEILFATWDGGGNVPPAVAIATVLQERGETVRFIGHETQRRALTEAGFAFTSYDGVRPFSAVEANSVPRLLSMFTTRALGRAVLAELASRPADVVVVDCLLVPILRALADSGQRYVSLEHFFDRYLRRSWLRGTGRPGGTAEAAGTGGGVERGGPHARRDRTEPGPGRRGPAAGQRPVHRTRAGAPGPARAGSTTRPSWSA